MNEFAALRRRAVLAAALSAFLAAPVAVEARPAITHHAASADVQAGKAMVSAADPRAAAAGVEILRAGGSATDAAIATMLALNVVEPQNSGIGGGSFIVRHDGASGAVATIDGRETAPAAADANWFLARVGTPPAPGADPALRQNLLPNAGIGGRSAGVPGSLAAMALAHRRYGRLPWARLFTPAIRLAAEGFVVSPRLHNGLDRLGRHVTGWARETYFPGGEPVAIGSTLKVPLLADTLRRIARDGPGAFGQGVSAERIATAVRTAAVNPAPMTARDVGAYRAKDRAPVCGSYRGWRICGMGPPSSGAITVLTILKQLERFDMAALGRNSPVAWHLFAESQRLAYADRDTWDGDSDFVTVPIAGLLDPAYLAQRSALLSPDRTLALVPNGTPPGAPARIRAGYKDDPGTTDLAVADARGDVVEVTTTINGYFGSGIAVDGALINNEMPDFDAVPVRNGFLVANRVQGGKRPRSSMSPTIVYGPDGKVRLAIGAAGGATIIAQVAKALVGVIDWQLSAQDAIAMGLIFSPTSGGAIEQGSELEAMQPALAKLGETLRVMPLGLKANAVEYVGGRWIGAADPRSEGVAIDTAGNVTTIARRANDLNGAHE